MKSNVVAGTDFDAPIQEHRTQDARPEPPFLGFRCAVGNAFTWLCVETGRKLHQRTRRKTLLGGKKILQLQCVFSLSHEDQDSQYAVPEGVAQQRRQGAQRHRKPARLSPQGFRERSKQEETAAGLNIEGMKGDLETQQDQISSMQKTINMAERSCRKSEKIGGEEREDHRGKN